MPDIFIQDLIFLGVSAHKFPPPDKVFFPFSLLLCYNVNKCGFTEDPRLRLQARQYMREKGSK